MYPLWLHPSRIFTQSVGKSGGDCAVLRTVPNPQGRQFPVRAPKQGLSVLTAIRPTGKINSSLNHFLDRSDERVYPLGEVIPARGRGNLRRKHIPFSEIAEDAMKYSRQNKRSSRSDEVIKKNLVEWFGARGADSLTRAELEERLDTEAEEREWAASTFNHYRSFLMLAYREGKSSRRFGPIRLGRFGIGKRTAVG